MTIRSRALVAHGDGSAPRVIEVLLQEPGPDEVLVEIAAAAVCSSERMVVDRGLAVGESLRTPATVLGHAAVGVVTRAGAGVTRAAPGDTVIVTGTRQCGACWFCAHGIPGACDEIFRFMQRRVGETASGEEVWTDGGMGTHAERMVLPASNVVRVEGLAADEHLALLGCGVTSGVGAVRDVAGLRAGQSVSISGLGHLGLWMVQGARACGAGTIIALDPSQHRRRAALRLGATIALEPDADAAERIREHTEGRGVDVALEAAGTVRAIREAFSFARYGGTVVPTGLESEIAEVRLDNLQLSLGSRRVIGSQCGGGDVLRMVPDFERMLADGSLSADPVITARFALDDAAEAYEHLTDPERFTSVIVMPSAARRKDTP